MPLVFLHREHVPAGRDALELVRPSPFDGYPFACDEVLDGPRDEDLAGTRQGHHPRGCMYDDAAHRPSDDSVSPKWIPARISTPIALRSSIPSKAQRISEPRGESGRRFVAVLSGVLRVAADVRDQERSDVGAVGAHRAIAETSCEAAVLVGATGFEPLTSSASRKALAAL